MEEIAPRIKAATDNQPSELNSSCKSLNEGLRSGVFDASPPNDQASKILKGFELFDSSKQPETIADYAVDKRQEFLANDNNRLPADVKKLWDPNNRVLTIGDQHMTTDIKQFTIDNMCNFKQLGAEAIGMELFTKDSQHLLDNYQAARLSKDPDQIAKARKAVEDELRQSQQGPPPNPNPSEYDREHNERAEAATRKTMEIIDAAIDAGLKPIAIEPNIPKMFASNGGYELMQEGMQKLSNDKETKDLFDSFTNPNISPQQHALDRKQFQDRLQGYEQAGDFLDTLEKARDAGFDFRGLKLNDKSGAGDKQWTDRLHDFRNAVWTKETEKYLKENPGARMLLFAGAQHFNYQQRAALDTESVNDRLNANDIGTTALQFTGGDFGDPKQFDNEYRYLAEYHAKQHEFSPNDIDLFGEPPDASMSAALRYTKPAQDAGVADKEFAFRIMPQGKREADYIVHLKQVKGKPKP